MTSRREGEPDPEVLIVGAGPTGLTLAGELARYGVTARIIDKAPFVSQHTKALGVQARTLELLERLGVTDEMVGRGLTVTGFNIFSELRQIARFDLGRLPSRYPYLLMLPQNEVEQILHDRLVAQGGRVDYATELVSFTDDGDGIQVQLRSQQGDVEHARVAWLAGCDGAHSLVRHQLGIRFEGDAFEQRFAVADVRVDWSLARREVFAFLNRGNFMAFFPMAGGLHRVAIAYPANAEPDGEVSMAELQESLDRNGPPGARITDIAWASRFRINQRKASRQSAGRVFLAGDAAHIHSLVGAQGMNTGMQDAINLAWKLAMHLQGVAPRALLDTYETERGSVARRLVHGTRRFTRMTLLSGPVTTAARRRIAPLVLSRAAVRSRIELAISQTDVAYHEGPLRAGPATRQAPAPGDRAPDAHLTTGPQGAPTRLYELLRDIRHVLLLFTGHGDDRAAERWSALDAYLGAFRPVVAAYRIVPSGRSPARRSGGDLHDAEGEAHERYGFPRGGFVLLRPDGYIAARGDLDDLTPLQTYLQRWVLAPARVRETPPSDPTGSRQ